VRLERRELPERPIRVQGIELVRRHPVAHERALEESPVHDLLAPRQTPGSRKLGDVVEVHPIPRLRAAVRVFLGAEGDRNRVEKSADSLGALEPSRHVGERLLVE
jgi:hypothetical protein